MKKQKIGKKRENPIKLYSDDDVDIINLCSDDENDEYDEKQFAPNVKKRKITSCIITASDSIEVHEYTIIKKGKRPIRVPAHTRSEITYLIGDGESMAYNVLSKFKQTAKTKTSTIARDPYEKLKMLCGQKDQYINSIFIDNMFTKRGIKQNSLIIIAMDNKSHAVGFMHVYKHSDYLELKLLCAPGYARRLFYMLIMYVKTTGKYNLDDNIITEPASDALRTLYKTRYGFSDTLIPKDNLQVSIEKLEDLTRPN